MIGDLPHEGRQRACQGVEFSNSWVTGSCGVFFWDLGYNVYLDPNGRQHHDQTPIRKSQQRKRLDLLGPGRVEDAEFRASGSGCSVPDLGFRLEHQNPTP